MDTAAQVKLPTASAIAKWRSRHKKLYFNFAVMFFTVMGALPGIGDFVGFMLIKNHVPLTVVQVFAILTVSYTVLVFGVILGGIAGHLLLIAEKLYFPENFDKPKS